MIKPFGDGQNAKITIAFSTKMTSSCPICRITMDRLGTSSGTSLVICKQVEQWQEVSETKVVYFAGTSNGVKNLSYSRMIVNNGKTYILYSHGSSRAP